MAAHTSRLNLYLPGGGLSGTILPDEQLDIDKINDNMKLIDAAIGASVVTSGTRPATPFNGQTIYESDTGNIRVWVNAVSQWLSPNDIVNVADLAALPALTQEGQIVHVDAINCDFQNVDGVWVQVTPASTSTAAIRDTEYAKAAAAYRIQGATWFLTGSPLILFHHNGDQTSASSGWQKVGLIKPTSAAVSINGSSVINDDGSVTVTMTGAGACNLRDVLTTLAKYGTDTVEVEITSVSGAGAQVNAALAVGTTVAGGTDYDWYGNSSTQNNAVAPQGAGQAAQPTWALTNTGNALRADINLTLRHAGAASPTLGDFHSHTVLAAWTSMLQIISNASHRLSTVYDSLVVSVSAATVLTIKVRTRP